MVILVDDRILYNYIPTVLFHCIAANCFISHLCTFAWAPAGMGKRGSCPLEIGIGGLENLNYDLPFRHFSLFTTTTFWKILYEQIFRLNALCLIYIFRSRLSSRTIEFTHFRCYGFGTLLLNYSTTTLVTIIKFTLSCRAISLPPNAEKISSLSLQVSEIFDINGKP